MQTCSGGISALYKEDKSSISCTRREDKSKDLLNTL